MSPPRAPFVYRHFPRLVFAHKRLSGENYEREMELLDLLCDRRLTSLDIGAKLGMYSYRILASSAQVIAFEPIPMFQDFLRAVFARRPFRVEPFAVSNVSGKATLRLPYGDKGERRFGRSTIEHQNALTHKLVARTEELEVETRTIDQYQLPEVGFIKIDVEGHEVSVLESAVETLAAHRPNLLIECNDEHHPEGTKRLEAWLRAQGYLAWFTDGRKLFEMSTYRREEHWDVHGVENFIAVHASRGDLANQIQARLSAKPLVKRADAR